MHNPLQKSWNWYLHMRVSTHVNYQLVSSWPQCRLGIGGCLKDRNTMYVKNGPSPSPSKSTESPPGLTFLHPFKPKLIGYIKGLDGLGVKNKFDLFGVPTLIVTSLKQHTFLTLNAMPNGLPGNSHTFGSSMLRGRLDQWGWRQHRLWACVQTSQRHTCSHMDDGTTENWGCGWLQTWMSWGFVFHTKPQTHLLHVLRCGPLWPQALEACRTYEILDPFFQKLPGYDSISWGPHFASMILGEIAEDDGMGYGFYPQSSHSKYHHESH